MDDGSSRDFRGNTDRAQKKCEKEGREIPNAKDRLHETLAHARQHLGFPGLLSHAEEHNLRSDNNRDQERDQKHNVKDTAAKSFLERGQSDGKEFIHSMFLRRTSCKDLR